MKVKAGKSNLTKLNPNSGICSAKELSDLQNGKEVDMKDESANQLINMGFVTKVKSSKVKEKNNG